MIFKSYHLANVLVVDVNLAFTTIFVYFDIHLYSDPQQSKSDIDRGSGTFVPRQRKGSLLGILSYVCFIVCLLF